MTTAVDPLRSTLDHLALDPRARSDRPYLITMLRRLGYSEAEIAAYLGEKPEPQPDPVPLREHTPVPEDDGERIIEVEYTGPGLRDFALVVPMSADEIDMDDPLGLGAGLEAGSMVIEGDPDDDELSGFLEGEGAISFDDEFAGDDDEFEAESDRDNEELGVREDDDDEFMEIPDDDDEERVTFDADDEFDPEAMSELAGSSDDDDDIQVGQKVVQFQGVAMHEAKVRKLDAAPEGTGLDDGDDAWGEDESQFTSAETMSEMPDGVPGAYQYGDWYLHSREEEREDGSRHRVYFFAKGASPNGTPSQLPDGYEVVEAPETGLPILRPIEDPSGARKRVRMKRVVANSPEEAEALLAQEGKDVLGSMPVDVQEHEEDL